MSASKPTLDERIAALREVTKAGAGRIPSAIADAPISTHPHHGITGPA